MTPDAATVSPSRPGAPAAVLSPLVIVIGLAGVAYETVLATTSLLRPYRFPIPSAVPIFDTPFALIALGIGYIAFERHRLRQDVQSVALGGTLWLTGLLAIAHIFAQPDYPGTPVVYPDAAAYFFGLSYLSGFLGVALATAYGHRPFQLSDRARVLLAIGVCALGLVLVIGVLHIRPVLPPLVKVNGKWTPFALSTAAPILGLVAVWAFFGCTRRMHAPESDPFARFFLIASMIWAIGLLGFFIYPYRYSISWYVAGFARPIGVGVLFIGLIREQAHLYREARARLLDLQGLHDAGQALVTSLDATQIVNTIAVKALEVSRATAALLFRSDPDARAARLVAWAGSVTTAGIAGLELPIRAYASATPAANGGAVFTIDLESSDAGRVPADVRDRMRAAGFRTLLAVPLATKTGQTFGMLWVLDRRSRHFTTADLQLFSAFGAQASVALENARAFEHLAVKAGHDAGLQEFAQRVLESTGEEAIQATSARFTARLLGADLTGLFLLDPKSGDLRLVSGFGWDPGIVGTVTVAPSTESFAGYAYLHKADIQVEDLGNERRFVTPHLSEHGVRSGIAVPLGVRQEPMGVLAAYYRAPHRFSEEENRVLTAVAQETALAVEKARVYAELQENLARLQETQAQLIQADKLKALGTLLSGMAHELNNPLSTIQLTLQMMKRTTLPDALGKRLDVMEEECDRASRIIRDLLVFARRKPPERRRTDLREVIRATLALQAPLFDISKVRVASDLAATPPILADAHQLQQVLVNLFTNATHAMKTHAGGGVLSVRSIRQGNEVVIQVEDTGPGIAPQHLGRIFDPFFTTKGAGEGTGLGLSLSIGIIEAHGGRMAAENVPGRGARFTLRLPIGDAAETAAAMEAPRVPDAAARDVRVLIVDDEEHLRRVLAEVLVSLGHQVDEASDGTTGMQKLEHGNYDVVLLDLRLPDVDGRAVFQWLTERDSPLVHRVAFMTGDTMSLETQQFLDGSGRPVVNKPLSIARVRAVIDEVSAVSR